MMLSIFSLGATVHVAAAPGTTPTTLNATGPTAANATVNFAVKGNLTANGTGVSSPRITLQNSTNNATWNTVKTITGGPTGWYAFTFKEMAPGTYYYRTTYDGNATYANATSNVVSVIVKIPTAISAYANGGNATVITLRLNGTLTVNGTLTYYYNGNYTGFGGQTVTLYQRENGTKDTFDISVATTTTDPTGAYTLSVKETTAGMYAYKVKYDWYADTGAYWRVKSHQLTVYVLNGTTPLNSTTTLTAAAPASATVSTNFMVTGKLTVNGTTTGVGGQTITLLKYNATSKKYDITLATTKTNNSTGVIGTYTFTVNEATAGTYSYEVTYAGSATLPQATSNVVTVTVGSGSTTTTALNVTASPTTVTVFQNFVLTGRLTASGNGVANQTIHFYSWNGSAWVDTGATAKTNATGWYSLVQSELTPGTYELLAKYLGSTTYTPSTAATYAAITVKWWWQ